jgi:glycosyltransferase involved in cell wall biosynthesis
MQKPVVSIVVPTLNEEKFIGQCLQSLQNQTVARERYEIIVSDSSSTDATVQIAKKYADKIVVCKKHSAGFGRNEGARHANSELLGFVDADTIVEKNWVAALIEGLDKGIACTGSISALEKDSLLLRLFFRWWGLQSRLSVMARYPIFPGFNFGVRKKEFDSVGGFSTRNITTEDIELGQKLKNSGKVAFSKKMHVRTSTRRMQNISIPAHIWNGISFVLFKKSRTWQEYRRDF